ncbi:hypothetical protein [Solemya velesiana gill symbiont]|uniref:hypothetical protein n=1 Tax=Solemya velesiana gill symbiont TaxID=1918948 RepID=UPI001FE8E4F6|nr:hypothetical protein [Solemya velesiana gill symbiont]
MGESKTDFQVFTELAYRIGGDVFGRAFDPKANRDYFHVNDNVDEAYLREWWETKVIPHQHVNMSWDEFKQRGVYKFILDQPHVAFRDQIENGARFQTPSGKIEILATSLAQIADWKKTMYGSESPYIPKWIEPWESLNSPKTEKYPYPPDITTPALAYALHFQ